MRLPAQIRFLLVSLVISASAVPGFAQVPPYRVVNLHFFVSVSHATRLEGPNAFRVYGEPDEIGVELSVFHDSPVAASGDQQAFARLLRINMRDEHAQPVNIVIGRSFWQRTNANHDQMDPQESLLFAPQSGFVLELRLRRTNRQRFVAGNYSIDLSPTEAAASLRMADGSVSRTPTTVIPFRILVGVPRTAEERGSMYEGLANEAMQEHRYSDAAKAARDAIDANPGNPLPNVVLGGAMIALNQCHEAAAALEKVFERSLQMRTAIPGLLGQAYVCAGDEASARRTLLRGGVSADWLDSEIARLKELTKQRAQGRR